MKLAQLCVHYQYSSTGRVLRRTYAKICAIKAIGYAVECKTYTENGCS